MRRLGRESWEPEWADPQKVPVFWSHRDSRETKVLCVDNMYGDARSVFIYARDLLMRTATGDSTAQDYLNVDQASRGIISGKLHLLGQSA